MTEPSHSPVLLQEVLDLLTPRAGETAVDCTAGLGGHSTALASAVGPTGTMVAFDLDAANLAQAQVRTASAGARFISVHDTFVRAPEHLTRLGLRADLVLADLGFSSNQMDDPARGMSFSADGPLDMRFNVDARGVTAAELLATLPEEELADIIYQYGEEPLSRKIARKLVQIRQAEPIASTARLARLVVEAYGPRARSSRMHPATRTFMALRIAVNDELGALRALLDHVVRGAEQVDRDGWLRSGARIAIISFHSLEDRLVKHAFADLEQRGLANRLNPRKKPIVASEEEIQRNPRSRSAKLRAARIGDPTRA